MKGFPFLAQNSRYTNSILCIDVINEEKRNGERERDGKIEVGKKRGRKREGGKEREIGRKRVRERYGGKERGERGRKIKS